MLSWFRFALSLLYPPACIACTRAVDAPHALCPSCWNGLAFITRPLCERLGTPLPLAVEGYMLSPKAIADPPVFQRARGVVRYEGTARDLVHRLKYGDRVDLSVGMGRMMARAGTELLQDADLIIPVPLHRWRLWRRRFNQAAALARVVARESGKPEAMHLLRRVKRTVPQTGLTKSQRATNLEGAFKIAKEDRLHVKDKRILLIDDVLTTGSTANACSRVLLRAGAAQVDVLAFALVTTDI